MDEIIILDEFPEYYIKIAATTTVYNLGRPDIGIEVDYKRQYYVRKKDIPNNMVIRIQHSSKDGIGMTESILVDFYFDSNSRIISDANIDLFIKFDSHSDMIKWKLSND